MIHMKNQVHISLVFFLIAASFGLILRLMQSGYPIANYKFLLHTHSHVALLGWVYNGAFLIICQLYNTGHNKRFNRLFWITQLTIIGMLFSFPYQGYAAVSITFSTLFVFCSYYLVYLLFASSYDQTDISRKFLSWGGIYLVISSLGPFALGYLMANDLGVSNWYQLSIYWFLHFLYNGFFVFVIFAHFTSQETSSGKWIFLLMNVSMVPLFTLSALWTNPPLLFYFIAAAGALAQLVAFYLLFRSSSLSTKPQTMESWLLLLCLIAYFFKLAFQLVACIPTIQSFVNSTVPYSAIGFIHLVMIGFFSFFLLSYLISQKKIMVSALVKVGILLLIAGFILSEGLLFTQSLLSHMSVQLTSPFFPTLTAVSSPMPIGILLLVIGVFAQKS